MSRTLAQQPGPRATRLARARVRGRRFLSLRYFAPIRIEQFTLLAASFVFSSLALFATPFLQDSLFFRLVGVGVGTLSLGVVFLLLRWSVSYATAKPLLGSWVYTAYLAGEDEPFTYGSADFTMSLTTSLSLRTRLYDKHEDALEAALGDNTPDSRASLRSQAFAFDSGELSILYELEYDEPHSTRQGQLFLRVEEGRTTVVRGTWLSSDHGRDLRTGRMVMRRPKPELAVEAEQLAAPELAAPTSS